ncbi:histone-lysine N-methyltransferase EHMT2-like [Oscarella lobularis]|uniref:histone-lysine N-methyltransferase EHMT2-like n=1 Tax=Oscarella lobularis TaxID=121494 RepID=UPI003313599B
MFAYETSLRLFEECNEKVDETADCNKSLLDQILQFARDHCLEALVNAVKTVQKRKSHSESSKPSWISVLRAVENTSSNRNLSKIIGFLDLGVNLNCTFGSYNRTLIHAAAKKGSVELLAAFKVAKGSLNILDRTKKKSPVFYAVEANHLPAVKFLYEQGADFSLEDYEGKSLLHCAAGSADVSMIDFLVKNCSKLIDKKDRDGWTALAWATDREKDTTEAVDLLLSNGADATIKDFQGNTSLHWAVSACEMDAVKLLLKRCNVNGQNKKGETALHIAAQLGHGPLVRHLLSFNADCTIANNAKETPVEIAKAMRRTHAVKEMADYVNNFLRMDISKGQEPFPILCVNEVDGTLPPSDFVYIKSCVEVKGLHIDRSMESMEGCNCGQLCIERGCNCARSSKRRRLWFDSEGKINADIKKFKNPIVFECNPKCSCSSQCPNRVVQKGLKYRLELFRTLSKGWGVRAKENIPMGSMICEYAGQLITDEAANLMKDDTYLFDLDVDGQMDGCMCINACEYGNVSRFINHSCEPNVFPVRVFTEHHDRKFPKMIFFAEQDISVDEEICFDYGDRFWNIKHKEFPCSCGTESCRFGEKKHDCC